MNIQFLITVAMLAFIMFFIKNRRWMLAIYMLSFAIPLDYAFYGFFPGYMGKSPAELRIAFIDCTFCLLVISNIINRHSFAYRKSVIRKNEFVFLVGYLSLCVLSLIWAQNRILVITELFHLLKIFIIFFYFLKHQDFVYKNINYIIYGILGMVVIQFTFSIIQVTTGEFVNFDYLLGYESIEKQFDEGFLRYGSYRAYGSMEGGPVPLALMMAVSTILGITLTMLPNTYKIRHVAKFLALLALITLFLTQSRNYIVALLTALFFMIFYYPKKRLKILIFLIVIIAVAIAGNYKRILSYKTDILISAETSFKFRQELIRNAIYLNRDNPSILLIGVGQNNYLEYQNKSNPYLTNRMAELPVHNVFLYEVIESGLIGSFFAFGFLILVVYHVYKERRFFKNDSIKTSFMVFLFVFSIFFIIAGNFSWAFFLYYPRSFCFVILAITLCMLRVRADPGSVRRYRLV